MRYFFLISLLAIAFSCQYSGFVDLTPNDGFKPEFAFNVPALNKVIYRDSIVQDSGWYVIDPIPDIRTISPFVKDVQYITTDTFAFQWQDYDPVMKRIHHIANGFDITTSVVSRNFTWLNQSQFYSDGNSYLIPMFNKYGDRYWLQVFRGKVNWYTTYFTARGIWLISNPKQYEEDEDVS